MSQFFMARLTTFLLWLLVAASAAFWILQNWNPSASEASGDATKVVASSQAAPEANLTPQVALALGAKNIQALTPVGALAAMQARLQLQWVLAVGTKRGAALISIDGQPAKPYRVGSAIEGGLEVTALKARSASISKNGQVAFTLTLPSNN